MGPPINARKTIRRLILALAVGGIIILPAVIFVRKFIVSSWQDATLNLTPATVSFGLHTIYSEPLRTQITAFITKQLPTNILSLSEENLGTTVRKQFPIIKSIDWNFTPERDLHFIIVGFQPRFIVNKDRVLTERRKLFSPDLFVATDLKKIPEITIAPRWCKATVSKHVASFLKKIPEPYFQKFAIEYLSPSVIKLYPRRSHVPCLLVTDEKSFFEEKKFAALTSIIADIEAQGLLAKKIVQASRPLLAFDLRFEKMVAVKFFDSFKRGKGK